MVDKRKVSITKHEDTTITQVKYGSGYKKTSNISMYETDININDPESADKLKQILTPDPSHEDLINGIEEVIFSWLDENKLPTSVGKDKYLPITLRNKHIHIKGVFEASFCLTSIDYCRSESSDGNFENAYKEALNLVGRFYNFKYSILESIISQGSAKKNLNNGKILSEHQADCLWDYFNSDECLYKDHPTNTQKRTKGKRLDKTAQFCLDKYKLVITIQTLDKSYFINK